MTRLQAALRRIVTDLVALEVRFALVGGLAVGARSEPRTTRDVDVAIATADDAEAEAIVFSLQQRGYRLEAAVEQAKTGRLATARLRAPHARGPVLDLLFASSGIETEVVRDAERLAIVRGLELPVASVAHLVALKVLARDDRRRPQDAMDLAALLRVASEREIEIARDLIGLIAARGYDRGKDLEAGLERAVAELT